MPENWNNMKKVFWRNKTERGSRGKKPDQRCMLKCSRKKELNEKMLITEMRNSLLLQMQHEASNKFYLDSMAQDVAEDTVCKTLFCSPWKLRRHCLLLQQLFFLPAMPFQFLLLKPGRPSREIEKPHHTFRPSLPSNFMTENRCWWWHHRVITNWASLQSGVSYLVLQITGCQKLDCPVLAVLNSSTIIF